MMMVVAMGLDGMSGKAVVRLAGVVVDGSVELEVGSDGSTAGGMIVGQKYLMHPWAEVLTTCSQEVGQSGLEQVAKL